MGSYKNPMQQFTYSKVADYSKSNTYIHLMKKDFNPSYTTEQLKKDTMAQYVQNRDMFKKQASMNLGVEPEEAMRIIGEIGKLAGGTIFLNKELSGYKGNNPAGFKPLEGATTNTGIEGKSFQAISNSVKLTATKNAKDGTNFENDTQIITQNAELLESYMNELKKIITEYSNLTEADLISVMGSMANPSTINQDNFAEALAHLQPSNEKILNLYAPGTHNTSMRKAITAFALLKKYQLTGQDSAIGNQEIMRSMAGWVKGIGGQGFEVMSKAGLDAGRFAAKRKVKDVLKNSGLKVSKNSSSSSGSDFMDLDPSSTGYEFLKSKKVVRKSDVNITMERNEKNGSFTIEYGLSLKQKKLPPAEQKGRTDFEALGGANLQDFLARAGLLQTKLETDLVNSIIHNHDDLYNAARNYAGAKATITSLTGLGTRSDMAYNLVFTNKVISMYDYLDSIAQGKSSLTVGFSGIEAVRNAARDLNHLQKGRDAYTRNRQVLNFLYDNIKVNMTGHIGASLR